MTKFNNTFFVLYHIGAALLGDDDSSSSSSSKKVTSGPSKKQIRITQKLEAIIQVEKNIYNSIKQNNSLLCFSNSSGVEKYYRHAHEIAQGNDTPTSALRAVNSLILKKNSANFLSEEEAITPLYSTLLKYGVKSTELKLKDVESFLDIFINLRDLNRTNAETFLSLGKHLDFYDFDDLISVLEGYFEIANTAYETCLAGLDYEITAAPELDFNLYEEIYYTRKLQEWYTAFKKESIEEPSYNLLKRYPELSALFKQSTALQSLKGEPRIVVCGLLNAGKSSLLNSILGDINHNTFSVNIVRETAKNQELSTNDICYIDTPGLDANTSDTKEAEEAYKTADVLLFIHSAERELVDAEYELLQKLHKEMPNFASRTLFVLTHIDLAQDDLPKLQDKILNQMTKSIGFTLPIFPISNKRYKKGIESNKAALVTHSGINELKLFIDNLCNTQREAISLGQKKKIEKLYLQIDNWVKEEHKIFSENIVDQCNKYDELISDFYNNICAPIEQYYNNEE